MSELNDRWVAYADLQAELAKREQVDGVNWGLEAALMQLLRSSTAKSTTDDLERTARSERRRERYRARLRAINLSKDSLTDDFEAGIDARRGLSAVRRHVSPGEWSLLVTIGGGANYGEIAADLDASSGCLRVRVMRLRRELQVFVADRAS